MRHGPASPSFRGPVPSCSASRRRPDRSAAQDPPRPGEDPWRACRRSGDTCAPAGRASCRADCCASSSARARGCDAPVSSRRVLPGAGRGSSRHPRASPGWRSRHRRRSVSRKPGARRGSRGAGAGPRRSLSRQHTDDSMASGETCKCYPACGDPHPVRRSCCRCHPARLQGRQHRFPAKLPHRRSAGRDACPARCPDDPSRTSCTGDRGNSEKETNRFSDISSGYREKFQTGTLPDFRGDRQVGHIFAMRCAVSSDNAMTMSWGTG